MKPRTAIPVFLLSVMVSACAAPSPPPVYNARVYTIDNQEIKLHNVQVYEKNYRISLKEFRPRWRQSLELVTIPFAEIASARKVDDEITRVQFRNGKEDEFSEFFVDDYNLKGWSGYGPYEINATLIRGLIFTDENWRPVLGAKTETIAPEIPPAESEDRFITFEGDIISGQIEIDQFTLKTAYGTIRIARDLISDIIIDRETETHQQLVKLKNGDIISGYLQPPRIRMRIPGDQDLILDVDQLSRIRFDRPVALEEEER